MKYRKLAERFIEAAKSIDQKISELSDYLNMGSQISDVSIVKKEPGRTTVEIAGLTFLFIHTSNKIMGVYSPTKNYIDLSNYNFSMYLIAKLADFIVSEINSFINKNFSYDY